MQRARHLLRSSIIVIGLFVLSKAVGLLRARFVAMAFGAGPEYDAFTAANQLPELFFAVIAGGSLAAALIPVYSQYLSQEGRAASTRLANTILTLVLLVLGSVSAVGILLAPWLTRHVLVPDFPPQQQLLTAQIMRVILIQTTIFGFSGALGSLLNAHQHFALPALAPLSLDLGYFVGLFLLVPRLGIIGLAWGTVVGALFHLLIQAPALRRYRIGFRPALDVRLRGVAEIGRLMGPRIVTLGVIQFADLFVIRLASGLPSGATSAYFYGYAIMQLPQTLFGTAIALVVFPTLAELYNAADLAGLRRTAAQTLSIVWTHRERIDPRRGGPPFLRPPQHPDADAGLSGLAGRHRPGRLRPGQRPGRRQSGPGHNHRLHPAGRGPAGTEPARPGRAGRSGLADGLPARGGRGSGHGRGHRPRRPRRVGHAALSGVGRQPGGGRLSGPDLAAGRARVAVAMARGAGRTRLSEPPFCF